MLSGSCFSVLVARIADKFKRKLKLILKISAGGSVLFLLVIALMQDQILVLPKSFVTRKFTAVFVNLVECHCSE